MIKLKFITANSNDAGVRLDKFLFKNFAQIPYSIIQKKIRTGAFKVNGFKKKASYKLNCLDKIYYKEDLELAQNKVKKNNINDDFKTILKKSIIFEDNEIIILNKPYGIPVQGGTKINFSIDDALPFLCSKTKVLRLTHRIDKNTTGILIIAKSKETAKNITFLFRENNIKKTYWTLVEGSPKHEFGAIKEAIDKIKINKIEKMRVIKNKEKNSITYFKTLDHKAGLSLLEVYPKTGKTHQIRVHLLSEGCPILGDKKYTLLEKKNNKFLDINTKMHLHAKSISFKLNKKDYFVEAEIPPHFLYTLKLYNFIY